MTRTGQHQRCISVIHWLEASGTLALGAMFVTALIGTPAAQAQTYTVLHSFKGIPTDGAHPQSGHLIADSAGNLYGTTEGRHVGQRSSVQAGYHWHGDGVAQLHRGGRVGPRSGSIPRLGGQSLAHSRFGMVRNLVSPYSAESKFIRRGE